MRIELLNVERLEEIVGFVKFSSDHLLRFRSVLSIVQPVNGIYGLSGLSFFFSYRNVPLSAFKKIIVASSDHFGREINFVGTSFEDLSFFDCIFNESNIIVAQ